MKCVTVQKSHLYQLMFKLPAFCGIQLRMAFKYKTHLTLKLFNDYCFLALAMEL